jgi:hypothetical protein
MRYHRQLLDDDLEALIGDLKLSAIDGASGVDKTAAASRRAASMVTLDQTVTRGLPS